MTGNANTGYADHDVVIVGGSLAAQVLAERLSERPALHVALINAPETQAQAGNLPMPWLPGQPSDYDGWAERGNEGWAFADVLPFLHRAQIHAGPPRAEQPSLLRALRQAAHQADLLLHDDFNGTHAYPPSAQPKPTLCMINGATVERIVFDGRRAIGVQVRLADGQQRVLRARKEVVVSAGTLRSPQLLMVSGIGEPLELRAQGVPLLQALPGVGRHLCAQLDATLPASSNAEPTVAPAGGLLQLDPAAARPDIQLIFTPAQQPQCLRLTLLYPRSRGAVTLDGPTMRTPPRITPPTLLHSDMARMVEGVKLAQKLLRMPALAAYASLPVHHGDEHALAQQLRSRCDRMARPAGACRMGYDILAVVDPQLRVHGVQGLRIVDASVMPTLVGGHTAVAEMLIAEKAAALMRMAMQG